MTERRCGYADFEAADDDIRGEIELEVNELKKLCEKNSDISEKQFETCLKCVFGGGDKKLGISSFFSLSIRCIFVVLSISVSFYFLISCHNPTKRFFGRHTQDLIYPTMRILRLCTLPLIKYIDAENYAHLYQEPCLVQNPFYKEPAVDCWPCEDVRFIMDLSRFRNSTNAYQQTGIPFIIKDMLDKDINYTHLRNLFVEHRTILKIGTVNFESSSPSITALEDLFQVNSLDPFLQSEIHVKWGLNKVPAVQLVRKLFKRPFFVPNHTEVALQKFIFINGVQGPAYDLPLTDFANVWLAQGSGSHLIVLSPSPQCRKSCNTVSVVLKNRDVLFYNWQFWRAKSYSINSSKEIGITYMGSFY